MTREEAIEILKDGELNPCVTEDREACDLAIKALEQQPCEDTISRQAAIDGKISIQRTNGVEMYSDEAVPVEYLKALPSAQPEQSIAQERYEDLREYFKECSDQGRSTLNDRKEFKSWLDRMKWHVMECDKLGRELEKIKSAQPEKRTEERTKTHACDLIDREAAIDEWRADFKGYVDCLDLPRDDYNGIMEYIDETPSAQPEIIRCKDCKHQVKEWRDDKRLKDKGYWVCGCEVVGDACGYWALLGQDDDYCSYAERREE